MVFNWQADYDPPYESHTIKTFSLGLFQLCFFSLRKDQRKYMGERQREGNTNNQGTKSKVQCRIIKHHKEPWFYRRWPSGFHSDWQFTVLERERERNCSAETGSRLQESKPQLRLYSLDLKSSTLAMLLRWAPSTGHKTSRLFYSLTFPPTYLMPSFVQKSFCYSSQLPLSSARFFFF